MRTKVFVATHGPLAKGLIASMEMIVGPQEDIEAYGLMSGEDPLDYQMMLSEKIAHCTDCDVLILFDLLGGSPFNSMISKLKMPRLHFVSGVNLGMLLEVVLNRDQMEIEALCHHAKKMGVTGIVTKSELLNERSEGE